MQANGRKVIFFIKTTGKCDVGINFKGLKTDDLVIYLR